MLRLEVVCRCKSVGVGRAEPLESACDLELRANPPRDRDCLFGGHAPQVTGDTNDHIERVSTDLPAVQLDSSFDDPTLDSLTWQVYEDVHEAGAVGVGDC